MAAQTKSSGSSKRNGSAAAPKGNGRAKAQASDTGYDARKDFHGQQYTGMQVGRGHKWKYDPGEWVEKKVTPDKWEFHFDVIKRRAGKAPEGSGVPVGTEYHWYVLAHQTAVKIDANDYETRMFGLKYKLAHKRADKTSWSASEAAQRRRLIAVLEELIAELRSSPPKAATTQTTRQPAAAATSTGAARASAPGTARAKQRSPRRKAAPSEAAA